MLIIAIIITFFFSLDTNSQKPVKIYGLPGNNSLRISNALFNLWLPLVNMFNQTRSPQKWET